MPGFPPELRRVAARLPYHLGLSRRPDALWSDFVELPPNRDLPRFAAPPASGSPDSLARFNAAHHFAAYWGLVADRLADAQVEPKRDLVALRDLLLQRWIDALSAATRDGAAARDLVDQALSLWREGLDAERAASRSKTTTLVDYIGATRRKLHWIAVSACAMYPPSEQVRRDRLRLAADLLLASCQLRDDALDADDDEALRGSSVAGLLGLDSADLFRAAPRVARFGAAVADQGGHATLSTWMRSYAVEIDTTPPPGAGAGDEARAALIALQIAASYSAAI